MDGELEIEAGAPVAAAGDGDDVVRFGVLPADRYATATHIGHPKELMAVTAALLAWGEERGLDWDVDGDRWACRLER